jgi:dynein heavy chain
MPKPFDFKALIKKYPYDYYLTMNTVLIQEIEHYNKLITVIVSSLKEVELVLRGLSAFSE